MLALSLAVAAVNLVPLHRNLRRERQANLLRMLQVRALAIGEYRARAGEVAMQIASRTTLRRNLEAFNRGDLDLDSLQGSGGEILQDAFQQTPEVAGIARLDDSGQAVIEIGTLAPRENWPIPPAGATTAVLQPLPVKIDDRFYSIVGAPILTPTGKRVGTDIVLFKTDRLQKIVTDFQEFGVDILIGTTWQGKPQFLFSPEGSSVAQSWLAEAIPLDARDKTGLLPIRQVWGTKEEITVAYEPIAGSSWTIVAAIDSREHYAPVRQQILATGSTILVLMLASAGGLVLLLRPLLERIALRPEELDAIVGEQTDELSQTCRALEGRVKQLAAQLTQTHQQLLQEESDRELAERSLQAAKRRLAGILDNAKEAIISIDGDYRITSFNRGAAEIFGYAPEEVLGESLDCLLPERFGARHRRHVRDFANSPKRGWQMGGEQTAIWGRRRDGTEFPAEASISKLQAGEDPVFTAVLRDISDRKAAEEALQRSEERLRLALKVANQGLYDLDLETDEAIVSPEYSRMLGYDEPGEYRETVASWRDRLHPEDREATAEAYRAYAAGEVPQYRAEFRLRGRDGWRWILSIGQFVNWNAAGKPTRMLGTHIDISDRRQAEATLQQLNADLAASNSELEQFAYVASHDLQEPLRLIANYTQLLAEDYRGKLDPDADEYIHFIVDSATRLQQLIQDLLAFCRVGSRGHDFQTVDCADALQEACRNLQLAITENQACLTCGTLPAIQADRSQLVQIWQNLIGNAIKFRSDEPPHIQVAAERQNGAWQFSLRDNGIGIGRQHAERIFEVFQRLHPRHDYDGTGIGLAICRRIVERHGGKIWVTPNPDGGSTFYFVLPDRPPRLGDESKPHPPSL